MLFPKVGMGINMFFCDYPARRRGMDRDKFKAFVMVDIRDFYLRTMMYPPMRGGQVMVRRGRIN